MLRNVKVIAKHNLRLLSSGIIQHPAQYGYRLLRPTDCILRVITTPQQAKPIFTISDVGNIR